MRPKKTLIAILFFILVFNLISYADEVYLKNGDKITCEIVEITEETIFIESKAIGTVSIRREFIERIEGLAEEGSLELVDEAEEGAMWDKKVSLGYNKTSGNTDTSQFSLDLFLNRNEKHVNEFTLKGSVYYSSSNRNMDAQKWYSSGRYAFSFGSDKKWYNFYRLEADHDRFANIGYRLLPSLGGGYWFFDADDVKIMAEMAIGYEYTDYRDATDDNKEVVFIPRGFFERSLFGKSRVRQNIIFYPAFNEPADYRLHSETVFTNPLTEKLSLNLSLIEDYDSEPVSGTKKNDVRLMSSLAYSF